MANLGFSDVLASMLGDPWLAGAGDPREKEVGRVKVKEEEERTWSPFLLLESSWAYLSFSSPYSAVFRFTKAKN